MKVWMKAFLCSIDKVVWDAVEIGWTMLEATKSTWDKAALVASNANSKAQIGRASCRERV